MRPALILLSVVIAGCPATDDTDPCDVDGDGWYKPTQECGGGDDCDDDDPDVNPDEIETCNGRDDNCDGYAVMCVWEDDPTATEWPGGGGGMHWGGERDGSGAIVCDDWAVLAPGNGCPDLGD